MTSRAGTAFDRSRSFSESAVGLEAADLTRNSTKVGRTWHAASGGNRGFYFCSFVFALFLIRDTWTGALRFALSRVGLSVVWFVPDVLCVAASAWFMWHFAMRKRSPWAILLVCSAFASTIIGWLFMAAPPFAVVSSIKLFLPFILGCCFAGRSLTEMRWMRWLLTALLVTSIIGLILNPYFDYPWLSGTVDNFGYAKNVGRLWWSGNNVRYGGFAGESTMAAYMCIFPMLILYRFWPQWVQVVMLVPIWYAIRVSTSKTTMGLLFAFVIYYLVTEYAIPAARQLRVTRSIAIGSFACVSLPYLMMIAITGIDLTSISPSLFSLQDRINNTWRFPFSYMAEHFPIGLLSGCGLGCFTYPMQYTGMASLWVPVDSFFVASYVMLGLPFVALVVGMTTAPFKSVWIDKLLLIGATNIYLVTVQGYGPSATAILTGYTISDMFLPAVRRWRRPDSLTSVGMMHDAPAATSL